jgi:hypothetical protein
MEASERKIVKVGARLTKFIGAKASRKKKLQAASMQAEFTLRDTLIMLCYLGRDSDKEIAGKARTNLIPAARAWHSRADRPELPEPVHDIVLQVLERVGPGEKEEEGPEHLNVVTGNIGLLGLGEIIQAIDHNNRTVWISLRTNGDSVRVFTENGKVVGAVAEDDDGLEVLYRAFGWPDASFTYVHEAPGDFRNRIRINTLNLVMDALERAPEEDPFENEVSRTWKVEGHLKIMNIFEIAEIFEMNSKRAVCLLTREDQDGSLYFGDGRIVNAKLGDLAGMEAACQLLAWPSARFLISRGGEEVQDVIHIGMQNLIIEAMRLLDEGVTGSDRINSEIQLINELFEGQDVVTLPVLDRVRLVFGEDEQVRDVLESDDNPVVRKAIKVKISKTVHRFLSAATEVDVRLKAAKGRVPLSTTEKLVLLSYLSHDEVAEVREQAKKTLETLDTGTYRKGLGSNLHPSVMDFLVRETIKDESIIKVACAGEAIFPETALYILDKWKTDEVLATLVGNNKLLESSSAVTGKLYEALPEGSELRGKIDTLEQSIHQGFGDIKVEGPLHFCGLGGLLRAALRGSRTGTIVLQGTDKEGSVFFSRGKTVGALYGNLEGKAAIEAILKERSMRFRYLLRTHYHVENVDPLWVEKLLETTDTGPFSQEKDTTGLRLITGSLEAMDVFEVLTALEGTPTPVLISIMCEEGSGEIYRDASRVLHAQVQGKEGPYEAMAAILSWSGTRFLVRYVREAIPTTVAKTLGDFFVESLKEVPDELKQVTKPGELPEWELSEAEYESLYHQILEMGVAEKIKLALLGSKEARGILVRDSNKMVAVSVVKSPKILDSEIEAIAKSRAVHEDVLRQIAGAKEWMKSYSVKLNLCSNSKTPVPIAMKLLPHLREYDLRKLAKSKDVSSGIATQARRLAEAKSGRRG